MIENIDDIVIEDAAGGNLRVELAFRNVVTGVVTTITVPFPVTPEESVEYAFLSWCVKDGILEPTTANVRFRDQVEDLDAYAERTGIADEGIA